MNQKPHQFTSDNRSRICPQAWEALAKANGDTDSASYGNDRWTLRAADLIRERFETDCDVYFVFTGTAANSLALAAMCQSYNSVICHETSHIETDECGAPEFFSNGTKLLLAAGEAGKLEPSSVDHVVKRRSDIHYPKPRVLSLTQATELGTIYQPQEIAELTERARAGKLRVHLDGARFGNAVASLGCSPAEVTWRAGVDVLCFGGTKTGMLACEAVVFFDKALSQEFAYRCKQAGQLASKMRYLAAQWVGMLEDDAWLTHAAHANAMARLLEQRLLKLQLLAPHVVKILFPVQANSVFVKLPAEVLRTLKQKGWEIYEFIGNAARLMCSWETTKQDIDCLLEDLEPLIVSSASSRELLTQV
jgi:threonine aldolase